MSSRFQIVPAGDAALILEFEERIDADVNAQVVRAADWLRNAVIPGVRDVVPTFRTVAVYFDPLVVESEAIADRLARAAAADTVGPSAPPDPIRIPVRYGGEFGPDLADVARFAELSEEEVVARHTAVIYRVFMLGFVPGFAYMGTVDPSISAPRRSTPRTHVPPGSVGIAGGQTGVYPADTPGGWQIIGRTMSRVFDLAWPSLSIFRAGDAVQFIADTPT